jgi:hypothetical protein
MYLVNRDDLPEGEQRPETDAKDTHLIFPEETGSEFVSLSTYRVGSTLQTSDKPSCTGNRHYQMLWGLLNNRRIVYAANGIAAPAHHPSIPRRQEKLSVRPEPGHSRVDSA